MTLQEAILIRNRIYGPGWPAAGDWRETQTYWWIDHSQTIMGSRGVIIDKADGHVHRLGSGLTLDEWSFAHERGFRHREYTFRITAVRDVALTLRLLWDMRYTHVKALVENPPFDLTFSWLGYDFLPRIGAAEYFDYCFFVSACDSDGCADIGKAIAPFHQLAEPRNTNITSERFDAAIRRFDELNAQDPNTELVKGVPRPRELVYAERLTQWVLQLKPDASEPLRLAARCQHLCRWTIPRSRYPMDHAGYLKWRTELKKFHAGKSAEVLREVGYSEDVVAKVQALNLKKDFPNDPDSQVLEDALCLVFLEFQFAELAAKTDDEKVINALRKSWQKMTEQAREAARKLRFGRREQVLLERALESPPK